MNDHKIKKLRRLSLIIIILGASLLSVTFVRGSTTGNTSILFMGIPPNSWEVAKDTYLFPPQNVKLAVDSNSSVNIYLLNSKDFSIWNETGELKAFETFNNISRETLDFQNKDRADYALLLFNPGESTAALRTTFTFYGFEKDLLFASIFVTVIGLVALSCMQLFFKAKKGNNGDGF